MVCIRWFVLDERRSTDEFWNDIGSAQDPEGFIRFTFPFTFATGVILFVVGMVGALGLFLTYPLVETLMRIVLIVVIVGYGMVLMKAQKRYLVGIE